MHFNESKILNKSEKKTELNLDKKRNNEVFKF